ncbi:MAG: fumarylacetoacetate hydrolase family protein [Planctomycetota bacterium]
MNIIKTDLGVAIERPNAEPLPIRHIIGIGRNYAEHAAERGAEVPEHPMYFTKNPASVTVHGAPIVIPACCNSEATGGEQVDYEAELAVVIGRQAKDVTESEALSCVLGYCCANDVSARWWQKHGSGGQFNRGKSFDTFCPLGPVLTPAAEVSDPQKLEIVFRLNGEEMQRDTTANMVYPVAFLISELSRGTTLLPGTTILTGTPSGVGAARTPPRFLRPGDVAEVEVGGLGVLSNPVEDVG